MDCLDNKTDNSKINHMKYKDDDIAVIGVGLHIANASSIDEYWEIFENNIDCIKEFPKVREKDMEDFASLYSQIFMQNQDISYYKANFLEHIDEFDNEYFKISPREAQVMDPIQRILVQTIVETFDDAGYTSKKLKGSQTGIYIGYTPGAMKDNYSTNIFYNNPELIKYSNVGNMPCIIPSRASYLLNLKGPTMLIDSACSSSLVAIHEGCLSIKNGTCSMAIAGGIKLHSFPIDFKDMNVGFESDDDKTRTFDNSASGCAVGEGVGCVLLKSLKEALKDKDNIYGVIKGSAINNDGTSTSITAPNPVAQTNVILDAFRMADVSPNDVGYIEVHGTATALGDPIEFRGLTKAFEKHTDKKQFCALSASKSNIGHLYEAAGVAAFIKALAALKHKKIPASGHFNLPNLKIDFCDSPLYINNQTKDWNKDGLRVCGVSAFGISGTNCHIVLQEYENKLDDVELPETNILAISAKSLESMTSLVKKYKEYLDETSIDVNLFASNANLYRTHYAKRLAIVFSGKKNLGDSLNSLCNCEPSKWGNIQGVYYLDQEKVSKEIDYSEIRSTLKRCNTNIMNYLQGMQNDLLNNELNDDLEYLAEAYSYGAKFDWSVYYKGFEPKHIPIPYYQFKKTCCWLPKNAEKREVGTIMKPSVDDKKDDIDILKNLHYERIFIESTPAQRDTKLEKCLLIHQKNDEVEKLFEGLRKQFYDVDSICIDNEELNTCSIEKYFSGLYSNIDFKEISHVVIKSSGMEKDSWEADELIDIHKIQLLGVICLYRELSNYDNNIKVIPIMNNCFGITGFEEYLNPNNASIFGLCKSFNRMFKSITSCCIDMDNKTEWDSIVGEICAISKNDIIAYRQNKRYHEGLSEAKINTHNKKTVVKDNGIYFVSGGLGGIGFETAMEITRRAKNVTLIIVGRSKLPDESQWDTLLHDKNDIEITEKIERMISLRNNAKNVEYYALDISDKNELQAVIKSVNKKYGLFNGVIHGAGISGGSSFDDLNEEYVTKMLMPKVIGTHILDMATRDQNLDFFLMFSSISTIFSSADLSGYIATNMYLDSYSNYRKLRGAGDSITVNWATWIETGMAVKSNFTISTLFRAIKTKEAINGLFSVLSNGSRSVVIGRINFEDKISLLLKTYSMNLSAKIVEALEKDYSDGEKKVVQSNLSDGNQYGYIEESLIKVCCKNLGYEDINIHHNFFELGANSILLAIIFKDIDEVFPGVLQVTDLFSYPTVSLLAEFISNKIGETDIKEEKLSDDSLKNDSFESDFCDEQVGDDIKTKSDIVTPIEYKSEDDNSVAIIGVGLDIPTCNNLEEYWQMLINGINVVRDIPEERSVDITKHLLWHNYSDEQIKFRKCGYLDEVNKFDHAFFGISPRDAALLDPVLRLFLHCCSDAIDDSGYGADGVRGSETGVFLGYTANIGNAYNRLLYEMDSKLFGDALTIGQVSMTASRAAYVFDLKGPSMVIDTACSSSLVALHMACEQIRNGKCEMALAGGASIMAIPLDDGSGIGFESPEEKTRAFADNSSGSALAEGVGVVLLKSLKKAQADGDSIYAVIKGSAINQDGKSFGIAAPNYLAQSGAIQKAWEDAGVTAKDISYIEAHGTGTQLGDPIEIRGINNAFEEFTKEKQICGIGSVKTNLGHANEASGMCGLFKGILSLQNQLIPPTLNFQVPNSNIDFINSPLYIVDKITPLKPKGEKSIIGLSGFGMSGTNAHIVLEEAPKNVNMCRSVSKVPMIFTVSAKTEQAVFELIRRYQVYLLKNKDVNLTDFSCTLNIGRKHYSYRLAFIYNNQNELLNKLNELIDCEDFTMIKSDWCLSGYYSIVPESKKQKYSYEITSKEHQNLSGEANELCKKIDKKNIVKLEEIIKLYIKGAQIEWRQLYSDPYMKLHLPTYPYAKKHAWYPIPVKEKLVSSKEKLISVKDKTLETFNKPFDNFFYNKKWVIQEDITSNLPEKGETYIIVHGGSNEQNALSQKLREKGVQIIDVILNDKGFKKIDEDMYYINNSMEDYKKLFMQLTNVDFSKIIHACACRDTKVVNSNGLYEELEYGFFNVVNLAKGLMKARLDKKMELVIMACNAYKVTGNEKEILPYNAAVLSIGRVIELEYTNIKCRAIDMEIDTPVDSIIDQLFADHNIYMVSLREETSYIEEFDEVEIKPETQNRIKEGGTYVITGGTTGIGMQIAKMFSEKASCNLILMSRRGFPQEKEWADYRTKEGYDEKIKTLEIMKNNGSQLEFVKCDINKIDEVQTVLESVRNKFGKINGVVHCAGVTKPGFILRKEKEDMLSVLSPKVLGTWNLDKSTESDDLDFIMISSSNVTESGESGQIDYMAANAFLDSYTDYLNEQGKNTYTVNWVAWKETGMAYDCGTNFDTTTKAITNDDALSALDQLLKGEPQRVMIGQFNENADLLSIIQNSRNLVSPNFMAKIFKFAYESQVDEAVATESDVAVTTPVIYETKDIMICDKEITLLGNVEDVYTPVEKQIGKIYCDILGYDEADIYEGFFEMGGDSILLTEMHDTVDSLYPNIVKVADLFEFDSIHSLAEFISSEIDKAEKVEIKRANEDSEITQKEQSDYIYYDMSCPQERIFYDYRISKNKSIYNIGFISDNSGVEYEELVVNANKFFSQFDMLRTTFKVVNSKLVQCVNPVEPIKVDHVKVESLENFDFTKYIKNFKLSEYPLYNLTLFEAPNKKLLFFDVHHILMDGYSSTILQEHMEAFGKEGVTPKPIYPYSKYVEFEKTFYNSKEYEKMGQYWQKKLDKFDFTNPLKEKNNDDKSYGNTSVQLQSDLAELMVEFAKKKKTTLFNLFLCSYALALKKFTKRNDIAILAPVLNRYESEFKNSIGVFTNMIPLRVDMKSKLSLNNLIKDVTKTTINGVKNQFYQYNHIVKDLRDSNPQFFFYMDFEDKSLKRYRDTEDIPYSIKVPKFILDLDIRNLNDNYYISAVYKKSYLADDEVEDILSMVLKIIKEIIEKDNLNLELDELTSL